MGVSKKHIDQFLNIEMTDLELVKLKTSQPPRQGTSLRIDLQVVSFSHPSTGLTIICSDRPTCFPCFQLTVSQSVGDYILTGSTEYRTPTMSEHRLLAISGAYK